MVTKITKHPPYLQRRKRIQNYSFIIRLSVGLKIK